MNSEHEPAGGKAQELLRRSTLDNVLSTVKALVSPVPVVGGSIVSLMDDFIPSSAQNRIVDFTVALSKDLTRLEERLNEAYVQTDEFAFLFTRVYQDVQREYQQEKLSAYRNILANALVSEPNASLHESFLFTVERLTSSHIRLLGAFHNNEPLTAQAGTLSSGFVDALSFYRLRTGFDDETIMRCMFDLSQLGLVKQSGGIDEGGAVSADRPSEMRTWLTRYGVIFIDFVSGPA